MRKLRQLQGVAAVGVLGAGLYLCFGLGYALVVVGGAMLLDAFLGGGQ